MSVSGTGLALLAAGAVVAAALVSVPDAVASGDASPPALVVHASPRFVEGTRLGDAGPAPLVRVRATWVRSDPSGVCAQRVRVLDLDVAGSTSRVIRPGRHASYVALDVVVGHRYRVEVAVTDCAGNAVTRSRVLSVRLVQESDPEVYLDDFDAPWNIERRPQASGGAWAFHRGQVVVFAATRSVALVCATGPGRGSAEVTSWSGTSASLDLGGDSRARVVVFQDRWTERTDGQGPVLEVLMDSAIVVDAVLLG